MTEQLLHIIFSILFWYVVLKDESKNYALFGSTVWEKPKVGYKNLLTTLKKITNFTLLGEIDWDWFVVCSYLFCLFFQKPCKNDIPVSTSARKIHKTWQRTLLPLKTSYKWTKNKKWKTLYNRQVLSEVFLKGN